MNKEKQEEYRRCKEGYGGMSGNVKKVPMIYGTPGEIPEDNFSWNDFKDSDNIPNGNLFPADGSNSNV